MANIQHVNPNEYKDFKDFNSLQKGDYILDIDEPQFIVLGSDENGDVICRNLETGKKMIINPIEARHLNYTYRRYANVKNESITRDVENQIAECLRLAGIK